MQECLQIIAPLLRGEATLRGHVQRLRDVGVTDFNAAIIPTGEGVFDAKLAFLESELSA